MNRYQNRVYNTWYTPYYYSYNYDSVGKLISDYYLSRMGINWDNSLESTYYYDKGAKLASIKTSIYTNYGYGWKNYGDDIYYYTYEYDDVGRKTKESFRKNSNGQTTYYRWIYTNDANGNLLSLSEEFMNYSTWKKNFTRTYEYDMDGKILADKYESFKWDNANVTTDKLECLEFGYDEFGNIVCVKALKCTTPYFYYNNMSNKWKFNISKGLTDSYMMKINYIDINKSENIYDVAFDKYDIKFYPNPVKNTLFINGYEDNFYFILTDFNGKIYMEGDGTKSIDVSCIKRGLYILRLIIKDQVVLSKILIE